MVDLILHDLEGEPFDIRLVMRQRGFAVIVRVNVAFDFVPGTGGNWSLKDRVTFLFEWKTQILRYWNQPTLTYAPQGRARTMAHVALEFDLNPFSPPSAAHWELDAIRNQLSESGTRVSEVVNGDVSAGERQTGHLYYSDILPNQHRWTSQSVFAHEFGHMIEFPNEYGRRSRFRKDLKSVMNVGSIVRDRHLRKFRNFARQGIRELPGLDAPPIRPANPFGLPDNDTTAGLDHWPPIHSALG